MKEAAIILRVLVALFGFWQIHNVVAQDGGKLFASPPHPATRLGTKGFTRAMPAEELQGKSGLGIAAVNFQNRSRALSYRINSAYTSRGTRLAPIRPAIPIARTAPASLPLPIDSVVQGFVAAAAPSSRVSALPTESGRSFIVEWHDANDPDGSGIVNYDLFISTNGGPYGLWLQSSTQDSALFQGGLGQSYAFYSVATDNVGNVEPAPVVADAETTVSINSPILAQSTNQTIKVGLPFRFTNVVTQGSPSGNYRFSLHGGPEGISINSTNGEMRWTPSCEQGGANFQFVVWVTDTAQTNLQDAAVFTVAVIDCLRSQLGTLVLPVGGTGVIPVQVYSTEVFTNISMVVALPEGRLTATTLESVGSVISSATLTDLGQSKYKINLSAGSEPWLQPTQGLQVAWLHLSAASNQPSALLHVDVGQSIGTRLQGTTVTNDVIQSTRVAVVGEKPLLESFLNTKMEPALILYALPGTTNNLQSITNLLPPFVWRSEGQVVMTTLQKVIEPIEIISGQKYFRAVRQNSLPVFSVKFPSDNSITRERDILVWGTSSSDTSKIYVNGNEAHLAGNKNWSIHVSLVEGMNTLTIAATDQFGNTTSDDMSVKLDSVPPAIAILTPANNSLATGSRIAVSGVVDADAIEVRINGVVAEISNGGTWRVDIPIRAGVNNITALAVDAAGNYARDSRSVSLSKTLMVSITDPVGGFVTRKESISISGLVEGDNAQVTVNDFPAQAGAGTFKLERVQLQEGPNVVTARARNSALQQGTASISIIRDTVPPKLSIIAPPDRSVSRTNSVHIVGTVDDATTTTSLLNGVPISLSNGVFDHEVALVAGRNLVNVQVDDAAGNRSTTSLTLFYNPDLLLVTEVNPSDLEVDVPVTSKVQLRFSEPVDRSTVNASSVYLRVGTTLLSVGISVSAEGNLVILTPENPLPPGHRIDVRVSTRVKDLDGNPMDFPFASSFSTAGEVTSSGLLLGEIYDDTRSLPLGTAIVEAIAPDTGNLIATAQSDGDGGYLIEPGISQVLIRVSKSNFTTVERIIYQSGGEVSDVTDVRLTPLAQPVSATAGQPLQIKVSTGEQLAATADAVPGGAEIKFTSISQQGAKAQFPLGWTPLGIVEIRTDSLFSAPVELRMVDRTSGGVTRELVLAFCAEDDHTWQVLQKGLLNNAGDFIHAASGPGQYALLLPDLGEGGPGLAIVGSPLPAGTELPIPASASASGAVEPASRLISDPSPAMARVTINAPDPMRSGTLLRGEFAELFVLKDGSHLSSLNTDQDFFAYRIPGNTSSNSLQTFFPVAPSRVFGLAEATEGSISVSLFRREAKARSVVNGADGGGAETSDGSQVLVPSGTLQGNVAVDLKRFNQDALTVAVPAGVTFIGGLQLGIGGQVSSKSFILVLQNLGAGIPTGAQVVVAQIRTVQGRDRLVFVTLAAIDGNALVSQLELGGIPVRGIREGGKYGFFLLDGELSLVSSTALEQSGRRDGHLVGISGLPFVAETDSSGHFELVSRPVPFDLTATGISFGDVAILSGERRESTERVSFACNYSRD